MENQAGELNLVPSGNLVGQVITYLSDATDKFGTYWSKNKKAAAQVILMLSMCLFSQFLFAPIAQLPEGFVSMYFIICGLLKHKSRGGNFQGNEWRLTLEEVAEYDPTILPKLFKPIEDNRLHETPNFVCVLNDGISEELYRSVVSTIAETTYNLDPFVIRNLTRLLHSELSEDQIADIENPEVEIQYTEFVRSILESLKNCYKSNIICFSCVCGLDNHEKAIKHIAKFHRNYLSPAEITRQRNERTNRLVREERQKWTDHHADCNPACNFR